MVSLTNIDSIIGALQNHFQLQNFIMFILNYDCCIKSEKIINLNAKIILMKKYGDLLYWWQFSSYVMEWNFDFIYLYVFYNYEKIPFLRIIKFSKSLTLYMCRYVIYVCNLWHIFLVNALGYDRNHFSLEKYLKTIFFLVMRNLWIIKWNWFQEYICKPTTG